MPRKSAAALSAPSTSQPVISLTPPRSMSKRAAAIFRELTASVEPAHFDAGDLPLLRQYCAAIELAERAEAALTRDGAVTDKGRPSPWLTVQEKSHRAMTALSLRLRLSPQSRATKRRGAFSMDF